MTLRQTVKDGPWTTASTWGGTLPVADDDIEVTHVVPLNASPPKLGKVRVTPTGHLTLKYNANITVQCKTFVLEGKITSRPAVTNKHRITFVGVDESTFVGGGHAILDTDPGVWVHGGTLDIAGSPKTAWTRTESAVLVGQTVFRVGAASGWRVGDTLVITPTTRPTPDTGASGQDVNHCLTFDKAKIAAISGLNVTLDAPLLYDHPAVSFTDQAGAPKTYTPEVLNLTRNMVIGGTATGRAHIGIFHQTTPLLLSHVEIEFVGPRQVDPTAPTKTNSVLGRYGLHFHECEDGTTGSIIEGVVIHDAGSHAFVPHASNGITFRDCVAFDCRKTAYWWDLPNDGFSVVPSSSYITFDRCVAAKVHTDKTIQDSTRVAGFWLAEGEDLTNTCVGCVAVGVHHWQANMTGDQLSGYHWPEGGGAAVWNFRVNLTHNVSGSGTFIWENDNLLHVIEDFTAYHCGKSGVDHGAYKNRYAYRRCNLVANRRSGICRGAGARPHVSDPPNKHPVMFEDMLVDGQGLTRWGCEIVNHRFDDTRMDANGVDERTIYRNVVVKGCTSFSWWEKAQTECTIARIIDCTFPEPSFWFEDGVDTDTELEVTNLNGVAGTFLVRQKDQPGTYLPAWNASRSLV